MLMPREKLIFLKKVLFSGQKNKYILAHIIIYLCHANQTQHCNLKHNITVISKKKHLYGKFSP